MQYIFQYNNFEIYNIEISHLYPFNHGRFITVRTTIYYYIIYIYTYITVTTYIYIKEFEALRFKI